MEDILNEIGLQDLEIVVYKTLLKNGELTVTQISHRGDVHRSYVYDLLEKLLDKGLVSFVIRNNVKYFEAVSPSRLVDYVKEKEEKVRSVIPELEKLSVNTNEEVKVEVYKGLEGFKTILNEIVKEGEDYFLFGQLHFEKIMPFYVHKILKEIDEKKMKETALLEEGEELISTKNSEYRWISKEYLFPNTIVIFGNRVAQFIWKEPYYAILTMNEDVAKSYMTHFSLLWSIASKKKKVEKRSQKRKR